MTRQHLKKICMIRPRGGGKPFSEQSDHVRRVVERLFSILPEKYLNEYPKMGVERLKSMDFLGVEIYDALAEAYGSQKAASKLLYDNGIKGIAYDDKDDGRCFVIFNPDDVKILEKFYQNQKIDMEALGAYTPAERKITLFRNNNLTTLIHKSGHY